MDILPHIAFAVNIWMAYELFFQQTKKLKLHLWIKCLWSTKTMAPNNN